MVNAVAQKLEDLSKHVWERIRDGHGLGIRQGEESLTDHLLLELCRARLSEIKVIKTPKSSESKKGTDWEWWIGSHKIGWIRYAVQAKKLTISNLRYECLNRKVGSSGERQIDIFKKYATATKSVALYCFYNYSYLSNKPYWQCTLPFDEPQLGCTVTPIAIVEKALAGRGNRTFKYFHSQPQTIPWRCLAKCPSILSIYKDNAEAAKEKFSTEVTMYKQLPPGFDLAIEDGSLREYSPDFYRVESDMLPRKILVLDVNECTQQEEKNS